MNDGLFFSIKGRTCVDMNDGESTQTVSFADQRVCCFCLAALFDFAF